MPVPATLRTAIQVVLAVALAIGTVTVLLPTNSTAHTTTSPSASDPGFSTRIIHERDFRMRLDDMRARHGLQPLAVADDLRELAREHSQRMAEARTLFHNARLTSDVCCWRSVSETVGSGPSVYGVHERLASSSLHSNILLDPDMNQVGIGVASKNGILYVTHVFRMR